MGICWSLQCVRLPHLDRFLKVHRLCHLRTQDGGSVAWRVSEQSWWDGRAVRPKSGFQKAVCGPWHPTSFESSPEIFKMSAVSQHGPENHVSKCLTPPKLLPLFALELRTEDLESGFEGRLWARFCVWGHRPSRKLVLSLRRGPVWRPQLQTLLSADAPSTCPRAPAAGGAPGPLSRVSGASSPNSHCQPAA